MTPVTTGERNYENPLDLCKRPVARILTLGYPFKMTFSFRAPLKKLIVSFKCTSDPTEKL